MTIANIQQLHDLAETSLASYATIRQNANDLQLKSDLMNKDNGASFVTAQADAFTAKYQLLNQQSNVTTNGFSATVFLDKQGKKVLAIRGTEVPVPTEIVPDVVNADILGIGASGYANLQGLELYRYWKKLTTVGGQSVIYTDAELRDLYALKLGPIAGLAVKLLPAAQILGTLGFIAFKDGLLRGSTVDQQGQVSTLFT